MTTSTPPAGGTSAPSRAAKQYARHQGRNGGRCNCASCVTYQIEQGIADDADQRQRAHWDALQPRQATVRSES